jgi:PEGA domain
MRLVVVVALAAALAGCASVTRGTTENISIASTPAGAEATISGLDVPTACITPCAIVAKRSADISITFAKPGYQTEVVTLTKEVPATGAAGFAGNILAGGLIGMGVDAATGAAQDHKPNPVMMTLKPVAPAASASARPPRKKPPTISAPEAGT